MDDKSLQLLEFPQVKEILSGFTSFSLSRELTINLTPSADYEQVALSLRQSTEAQRFLSLKPDFTMGRVLDIRELAKMAALGKVLEPISLVEIQETLTSTRQLRRDLSKLASELPLLHEIAKGILEFRRLEEDISNCLSPEGEVLDTASTQLASLRQKSKQVREQLLNRLQGVLRSPRGKRIIQEPIIAEREGRYVVPVKSELRREIKGIVHDVSNTGATVFVEPYSTIELGNELREVLLEERREVERILRDLSNDVGANEAEISRNIVLVAELDLALSKAKYAQMAKAVEPVIVNFNDDRPQAAKKPPAVLKLLEARHPLLGAKAVPLSVEIGRDFFSLIITGPNTGGKTVALKTIGLLSAMVQAGIPVPVSPESCFPIFDGIFADIGDEQSIEQTLSTFSWHIGNIVRIIRNTTEKSLVLLDELGTSTDPAEGSALARSILLHFRSRGTMTVATTHFGDLKAFAHATPGLQNASLDFDPVTLAPTYHLTVGIPGGSNALVTASRLGLLPEIISNARGMLAGGNQELGLLLTDLQGEKQRAEALRCELEQTKNELEEQYAKLNREFQRLKDEEQNVIRQTRDTVLQEAAELYKEIRNAALELRREKTRDKIEQAKRAVASVHEQLSNKTWQPKVTGTAVDKIRETITPGDTVRLRETNMLATVVSVSEATQRIEVQAGNTRLDLSLNSVEKATSPKDEATSAFVSVKKKLGKHRISLELNLRGKRADEVEVALDRYLNEAYLSNLSEVRIIHGTATGTVRKIVREFLPNHSLVRSFRAGGLGEGGDGVTIVALKLE